MDHGMWIGNGGEGDDHLVFNGTRLSRRRSMHENSKTDSVRWDKDLVERPVDQQLLVNVVDHNEISMMLCNNFVRRCADRQRSPDLPSQCETCGSGLYGMRSTR